MERLYTIILLTIISVFEIILLLNRELLPYELIVILMFLVLVFMMLFMLNQRAFWNLALLAFVLNLVNIAYLMLVFGRGYILCMATALALVGMLISLISIVKRKRRKVVKKTVTKLPKEEPRKSVEIEREIKGITLDKPRVIIEEYKPVVKKAPAKKKAVKKKTTKKKATKKKPAKKKVAKKKAKKKATKKPAKKVVKKISESKKLSDDARKRKVSNTTRKTANKYVASAKAKTYHLTKCDWADNIKRKNKVFFASRKKAENLGLKPHTCVDPNYKPKKKVVKKKATKKKPAKKVKQVKKTYKPGKYVASTNGGVYHAAKCKWANNIERKNRVWFSSRQKAEKLGYSAHSCLK